MANSVTVKLIGSGGELDRATIPTGGTEFTLRDLADWHECGEWILTDGDTIEITED